MGLASYVDTDRELSKAVFVPGVGCTVNSIMDMNNIESTHGSQYDTAGLHRKKDPGVGAFSPYHASVTDGTFVCVCASERMGRARESLRKRDFENKETR